MDSDTIVRRPIPPVQVRLWKKWSGVIQGSQSLDAILPPDGVGGGSGAKASLSSGREVVHAE